MNATLRTIYRAATANRTAKAQRTINLDLGPATTTVVGATALTLTVAPPTGGMSLAEAVDRLSTIAVGMLDTACGTHTVLAFLGSQGTAHLYGSDAAAVVARVIRGAA